MNTPFEDDIINSKRVIDFHTHPYSCRDEYMGMYGEDFYLEPEQMPEDLGTRGSAGFAGLGSIRLGEGRLRVLTRFAG